MALRFEVLGRPPDGPRLRLDYRRFSYAGKFVTPATGTAVARDPTGPDPPPLDGDLPPPAGVDAGADGAGAGGGDDGDGAVATVDPEDVVAAVAFNGDRTDPGTLWLRYVTVRADRRGEGIGPRLVAFVAERAAEWGYDRLRIAVNNPFSYRALYRAGFAFAGRETGLAELVLERPAGEVSERDPETYRAGLEIFRGRDLSGDEEAFLDRVADGSPPATIDAPESDADGGTAGSAESAPESDSTPDSGA